MKKVLCLLLSVVLMISFAACGSDSDDDEDEGSSYKNIEETPAEDFEYEIQNGEVVISAYLGSEQEIRIPEKIFDRPVVLLEKKAFAESDLTYVVLPDTIREIGELVFYQCEELETVKLPSDLQEIPGDTFSGCKKLKKVILPDNLVVIENGAFSGCLSLEKIDLPESLKEIEYAAFCQTGLKKVKLPEALESIEEDAFAECINLKELEIPDDAEIELQGFVSFRDNGSKVYGVDSIVGDFYADSSLNKTPQHTIVVVNKDSYAHQQILEKNKDDILKYEVR